MIEAIIAIVGLAIGGGIAWTVAHRSKSAENHRNRNEKDIRGVMKMLDRPSSCP